MGKKDVMYMERDALYRRWEGLFASSQEIIDNIYSIVSRYPEERSIEIDYDLIDRFDHELAIAILNEPEDSLKIGEHVLQQAAKEFDPEFRDKLHIRIFNLPKFRRIMIRKLRAEHIGKAVAVEGLVRKVQSVLPRVTKARFQCLSCGHINIVPQEDIVLVIPKKCGGCEKTYMQTSFRFLSTESEYVDTQSITLQESPEGLMGGEQPERIEVILDDDLTGKITPGDKIIVTGILTPSMRRTAQKPQTIFRTYIKAIHATVDNENKFENITFTEKEIKQFETLAMEPNIYDMLTRSLAPEIYGHEPIKMTIIHQLFGGVRKKTPGTGMTIRGDIHVLLVGDPGTAKSQLLRQAYRIVPRGIYASGKASTGAGLTATAVKESTSLGEATWTLEAGALVLADMGFAAVDELDKMRDEDRSSMHEAMEQQTISVAKAGITATLQARCTILAAANPKFGIYDENRRVDENLNLPATLISRFDAIFILKDRPDKEKDSNLVDYILGVHRASEIMAHRRNLKESEQVFTQKDEEVASEGKKPPLSPEFLKKYIAYAKQRVSPVLTQEAAEVIKKFFVDARDISSTKPTGSAPITIRQLEAVIRLSEASARIRLSNFVDVEDVQRAIDMVKYFLNELFGGEEYWDVTAIETQISSSEREHINFIINVINEEIKSNPSYERTGVPWIVIEDRARAAGYKGRTIKAIREELIKMRNMNMVYCPRRDHYKVLYST